MSESTVAPAAELPSDIVHLRPSAARDDAAVVAARDEQMLNELGYKQDLTRGMSAFDNWATSFGALYCIGGVQVLFSTALQEGGPLAIWTNWIIASLLTYVIACCIAEVCSAYPTAGSMYYWAFKCGGPKYGPLLSWVVAWLTVLAWVTNVASDVTSGAQFITNEPLAFNITSFDIDLDDQSARVNQFAIALALLIIAGLLNLIKQKYFVWIYWVFTALMAISFVMNVIWLPIAAHSSYGFQNSTVVWTSTINNVDGVSMSYSWMLSLLFPMYTLAGFDASGHVAEETKHADLEAPKGIVNSVTSSALISFPILIIFLYCLPDINDFINSPYDTNVQIIYMYEAALGVNGQAAVVTVGIVLWLLNATITLQATSRIVFAIARDHVLPFSSYLRAKNRFNQPFAAVLFSCACAFIFLLTILPSQVAFASITSASVVSIVVAYSAIIACRITLTRKTFRQGAYNLGRYSVPMGVVAVMFGLIVAVCLCLPTSYPVTVDTLNFAPIIFASWLVLCLGYWVVSASFWFRGPVKEIEDEKILNLEESIEDSEEGPRKETTVDVIDANFKIATGGSSTSATFPEAAP
ncbi:amino acid permease-domain-containing protein [Zopfochytrium polystomum]|nr:amino acid permease-domain-containing protein [Zopfochytrium polystomum]